MTPQYVARTKTHSAMSVPVQTLAKVRVAECDALPAVIAHRGAAADAPENTLAAFELALRRGADGLEFDVQVSSDGIPLVIHDPRLERTTSGSGAVSAHTAASLRRLDAGSWFNKRYPSRARTRYAGLKIPLLSDALEWVREQNCRAFVELKADGDTCRGIEAKVVDEIARAGAEDLTTLISFDLPTLERCRRLDPDLSLGIDFSRPLHALAKARAIRAASVHPHWMFVSPRFVNHAHRAGLQVLVWGLDSPEPMRRQMTSGIDGLMTDYPARAVEIRARVLRISGRPASHSS